MYKPLKSSLKKSTKPSSEIAATKRVSRKPCDSSSAAKVSFAALATALLNAAESFLLLFSKIKFAQLRLQYASLKYCFLQDTAYFISSLYGAIFCRPPRRED